MNAIQFVSIALRLFGLWLGWRGLQMMILTAAVHQGMGKTALISYGVAATFLAGGLLLWHFSMTLARCIADKPGGEEAHLNANDAAVLVVILVGLVSIAITGLEDMGDFLTTSVMLASSGQASELLRASVNVTGIVALVKITVGLLLVAKSRAIAMLVFPQPVIREGNHG